MDCQNFKELLDSYLCGELAVETNHVMLCHAERCGACRGEMAARRRLRASLRRVCSKEKLSDRAMESLRARIRLEAGVGDEFARTGDGNDTHGRFAGLFKIWLLTPVAVAILLGAALGLYVLRREDSDNTQMESQLSPEQIKALELSASIMAESAGDHRTCAAYFVDATGPAEMPDSVREYDPACLRLDKVAAEGARGLLLRSAHVCEFGDRKFAHLVYTRDDRLVSLLVTVRDCRALKSGAVPSFTDSSLGPQRFTLDHISLGAYQTLKRIILVASDLPEAENTALAESLARPVVEYLRKAEARSRIKDRGPRIEERGLRIAGCGLRFFGTVSGELSCEPRGFEFSVVDGARRPLQNRNPQSATAIRNLKRGERKMISTAMNLKLVDQNRASNFLNLLSLPHVERTFWRGMSVYTLDDPAADVYVVLKGRVKIMRSSSEGARKIVSICYSGEIFGELALAGDDVETRRSDEAVALDTTRVAVIRTVDFWSATLRDPSLTLDAMRHVTRRLAEAHSQIESLVFDNNHRRLARALLRLSDEAALSGESTVRLTHEELAELIGSTREVVTGMMIEFRQRGLIDYKRGDIRPNLSGLTHFLK